MNIFLAGGTGFVGEHVRKALLSRGHRIKLLAHRRSDTLETGVEQVEGDVTHPETFASSLNGCDAAINLVGIIREFPAKGITFQRLHVQATRNMVEAAKHAGVRRYLQMSALGTREGASSQYHRTKFEAEQQVRGSGLDYTIFRPSIIFGPKDDFVNKLAEIVRSLPFVPVIGDGNYRLQPIAADDVARCLALALEMPETVGKTYELCGKDRLSYDMMLDAVGRAMGKSRVIKVHSPLGLMKPVISLLQNIPAFPITMDQLLMLIEENICDGSWRKDFQFEPISFEGGIGTYIKPR